MPRDSFQCVTAGLLANPSQWTVKNGKSPVGAICIVHILLWKKPPIGYFLMLICHRRGAISIVALLRLKYMELEWSIASNNSYSHSRPYWTLFFFFNSPLRGAISIVYILKYTGVPWLSDTLTTFAWQNNPWGGYMQRMPLFCRSDCWLCAW